MMVSCLLAVAGQSQAASYYVDYSGGDDANSGASTDAAWKHCPGDVAATGTPAGTQLAAGDTVFFKGGVTYVLNRTSNVGISLNWNGTVAQPITYDGNSAGSWGTGRARLTGDYSQTTAISQTAFSGNSAPGGIMSNLVFNNLEIGPVGGSSTLPPDNGSALPSIWGGGITSGKSMSNVTIQNCYFHQLGYWFNQKPMNANSVNGQAVTCYGCASLTITNCEFTQVAIAIQILVNPVVTNLTIANCNFHNFMVWCISLPHISAKASMDAVYIHDNTFHDTDKDYSATFWTGYGAPPHQDAIFSFGSDVITNVVDGLNINIYNNLFYATFVGVGGSADINLTTSTSANIYNNVFARTATAEGAVTITDPVVGVPFLARIYNNTFYCDYAAQIYIGGKQGIGGQFWPTNATPSVEVDVKNNIMCDIAVGSGNNFMVVFDMTNSSGQAAFKFDRDDYLTYNRDNTFSIWAAVYGELGLAVSRFGSLRSLGWETNGLTIDPGFVDMTHGDNGYLNNYHLMASSPCQTGGANLTSLNLPGLNFDRDGNPRPATGPWSMGAYQGTQGPATRPSPPTGLRVLPN